MLLSVFLYSATRDQGRVLRDAELFEFIRYSGHIKLFQSPQVCRDLYLACFFVQLYKSCDFKRRHIWAATGGHSSLYCFGCELTV